MSDFHTLPPRRAGLLSFLRSSLATGRVALGAALCGPRALILPDLPASAPEVAIDAALVSAIGELGRLDAEIAVLLRGDERDAHDVPGYQRLEDARSDVLALLIGERARALPGLQAKARALLTLTHDPDTTEDLGRSLARDLLGADDRAIEPRPDPVFAAIEECERLEAACTAEYAKGNDGDSTIEQADAASAVWGYVTGPLSETVPTTASGCIALARFIPPLFRRWDVSLSGEHAAKLFRLIERSPAR